VKPPKQVIGQGQKRQEDDHTYEDDDNEAMNIEETSSASDILRIQEPAVMKLKGRSSGALNKVRAGASQRRRRAFEKSTRREPSDFEYAQTQIPDSQPPPPTQSQRDRREGRQRGERGGARGATVGGHISGVPESYMSSFQM